MIETFRTRRAVWQKEEAEAKSKPKGRGPKVVVTAPAGLKLDDLGI